MIRLSTVEFYDAANQPYIIFIDEDKTPEQRKGNNRRPYIQAQHFIFEQIIRQIERTVLTKTVLTENTVVLEKKNSNTITINLLPIEVLLTR